MSEDDPQQDPASIQDLAEEIGIGDPGLPDAEDPGAVRDQLADAENPEDPSATTIAGDDMFDQEPVFGRRSFILPRVQLPTAGAPVAALPEGQATTLPGQSGVVAIFCPEEFRNNPDKIEECAGRTEIRSGWRPGASGEDFSKAARLLRKNRETGFTGQNAGGQFSPEETRRFLEAQRRRALQDPRRSAGAINDLGTTFGEQGNNAASNRPNIGPRPVEPSWTLREDPNLSAKDLERLRRDLEKAESERLPDDD